ncbi:MAG: acetolactate decarboxylase [Chitinophagales bacterium]|nr:acetolactate decarboxylase [Chitinophagales bacterium]
MNRKIIFILITFFIVSCGKKPAFEVVRIGQLEDLIKKGDMKTHAKLQDFDTVKHLYAIGSVTDLKGYIQIIDGKSYTSSVINGAMAIDSTYNIDATLLLYSEVNEWKEVTIPNDVTTMKQLQQFIGTQADKYKIPKSCASPFLLKGIAADAKWRVVDWDKNDKKITYKKTIQSGISGELNNEEITAIGFYSKETYEVLSHKDNTIHMHFVNHKHTIAGHIDDLTLDGRMKLYLPKKIGE